jgi:chaperonin cofactor prefoldin
LGVAEEERQYDTAAEVLYLQSKKESKAKEIENQIVNCSQQVNASQEKLVKLGSSLLELLRVFPIPVDLDKYSLTDSGATFPYFEGLDLGNETVKIIAELLRQEQPLVIEGVCILPNEVLVKTATTKQEAIRDLVTAIQTFRIRVDTLSKSYEKIDELIDRLTKSKVFAKILLSLDEKGKLTVHDLAKILGVNDRTVYDGCYNLTRSNWSPNPIQNLASGEWVLTLAGQILAKRLLEKHPEMKTQNMSENRQSDGVPNRET